jgi:hypothetical protein
VPEVETHISENTECKGLDFSTTCTAVPEKLVQTGFVERRKKRQLIPTNGQQVRSLRIISYFAKDYKFEDIHKAQANLKLYMIGGYFTSCKISYSQIPCARNSLEK